MTADRLAVAVVGAGRWAQRAHIPGWQRDPRAQVVALADTDPAALAAAAAGSGVSRCVADYRDLLDDPGIDVIDVVTGNQPHFQVSWDALSAGKHVLCEKPVHTDFASTRAAAELANAKGLKTKVGFTFRYAPAIQYARELIEAGFVGEPYIFNGYEQNSQWIDPATPLRQVDPDADPAVIAVSSIEGYGAPIIDIMHWWLGAPLQAVVGTMRNFVPVRMIRDTGVMSRAGVALGSIIATANADSGISITGVANELASRKFRAIKPTMRTRALKKISVGTAARYASASVIGETLNFCSPPEMRLNVLTRTNDMLSIFSPAVRRPQRRTSNPLAVSSSKRFAGVSSSASSVPSSRSVVVALSAGKSAPSMPVIIRSTGSAWPNR